MLVRNLLYVTCKHQGLHFGTLAVLVWQLICVSLAHLFFSPFGDCWTHLAWLAGIISGLPLAAGNLYGLRHSLACHQPSLAGLASKPPIATRPPKILFVLNSLDIGGAERLTVTLANSLNQQRFHSCILCLKHPGPLANSLPPQVDFYPNFAPGKYSLWTLLRMVRLILSRKIDLLVSVGNGGDRMFWSSLACLLTARPLVIWCHSLPSSDDLTFEWYNRLLRPIVCIFVAVSTAQAQALNQFLHIPASNIKLIENALPANFSTAPHTPTAWALAKFRKDLNLPSSAFLIATVANFRPVKGYDVLIDAAAQVLPHSPDAYFLLIGQGSQEQDIRLLIQHHGLDERRIIFLGHRLDVDKLLPHCDLFVLPSHQESFGLAILEAMAAGLPIVATNTLGARSLINHNQTGLLCPVARPDQLAQTIMELSKDPAHRVRLAHQARQFAQQHRFQPPAMTAAFERLFSKRH